MEWLQALTTNVLAGKAVNNTAVAITFPTGSSVADQQGRINAAAVTLQNLVGPGQGCPLVSTTLGVRPPLPFHTSAEWFADIVRFVWI